MADQKIKAVGLFGNPTKQDLPPAAATIAELCSAAGVTVLASDDLQGALDSDITCLPNDKLIQHVDVVIAFGGDGTMLRAARVLGLSGVPLLGVNLGSLGYLTDVPIEELASAVTDLLAGNYRLDARSRVYCSVWRDGKKNCLHQRLERSGGQYGPVAACPGHGALHGPGLSRAIPW